jgi:mannose-1-phosphate guanylyltransferase/mannose-1-phosphate guanylyltransferase/mannose-6-phosphate isomerase
LALLSYARNGGKISQIIKDHPMTTSPIQPVILSGGSGTRLWPMSTEERPKQFLPLTGDATMFELTLARCPADKGFAPPMIVGNARHADLVEEQFANAGIAGGTQILEPCARNTAPAIALAALACEGPDTLMLVMPSDHVIRDLPAFHDAVARSAELAQDGWLVTFGITPQGPETGYGYIRQGEAIGESSYAAAAFIEKPDATKAQAMLDAGGHFWNAGIFLLRAGSYLEAMGSLAPDMLSACTSAIEQAQRASGRIAPDAAAFATSPSNSIDYAIMEKSPKVAVTPVNPGWSDVGSWDSLADLRDADAAGNICAGDALALDAAGNLILAGDLSISVHGVHDLIIIAEGKNVMILPRGASQNVKKIVEARKGAA